MNCNLDYEAKALNPSIATLSMVLYWCQKTPTRRVNRPANAQSAGNGPVKLLSTADSTSKELNPSVHSPGKGPAMVDQSYQRFSYVKHCAMTLDRSRGSTQAQT